MANLSDLVPWASKLLANTFSAKQTMAASASGGAGLRLPHGSAPSAPADGDVWTTTAGTYVRINGATVGPFAAAGGLTLAQTTAATSGTTIAYTSIPATAKRLWIIANGVSLSGVAGIDLEYSTNNGGGYTVAISFTAVGSGTPTVDIIASIDNYAASTGAVWINGAQRIDNTTPGVAMTVITPGAPIDAVRLNTGGAQTFDLGNVYFYLET